MLELQEKNLTSKQERGTNEAVVHVQQPEVGKRLEETHTHTTHRRDHS